MKIECCTACNFGGHKCQDALVAKLYNNSSKGLFVVCDGLGALHMGAEASKTVVDVFARVWDEGLAKEDVNTLLVRTLTEAKTEVDKLTHYDTGTTLVALATEGEEITLFYMGDSRAYYHREKDNLLVHTVDHITIGEEGWPYVSKGIFNFRDVNKPTIIKLTAKDGDRILLCTDDLYGCYKRDALLKLLAENMPIDGIMGDIVGYCDEYATDDASGIIIEFKL